MSNSDSPEIEFIVGAVSMTKIDTLETLGLWVMDLANPARGNRFAHVSGVSGVLSCAFCLRYPSLGRSAEQKEEHWIQCCISTQDATGTDSFQSESPTSESN